MKTKLLLTALMLISFVTWSQTTVAIPDDVFEAYLETTFASNIVPDGSTTDGSITFTDITLITDIDLPTAGVTTVTDLTSVNQFSKLKNFYCNGNDITGTLDLSGLSYLTNFSCFDNPNLTEINFTGCKNLYNLKAYSCSLTSIDLSVTTLNAGSNPARLRFVDVNTNNLTNVNISDNTGLYKLDVYENAALTSIDISNLTLLTTLRFQKCDITGDIDVSKNSLLETLGAYDNDNLTSIDLGSIKYTNFVYFKTSSSDHLSCIYTDNPSHFEIGGLLETAIGTNYSVDAHTNFVVNAEACALLSSEKFKTGSVNIFPNPSNSKVYVSITTSASYSIFNINGQSLKKGQLSIGKNTINIDNLSNGLYFLNIITKEGSSISQKLIKQ